MVLIIIRKGVLKKFENNFYRGILYFIFAVIIWGCTSMNATIFILPALTMTLSAIFYGIAGQKKEERTNTVLTGGVPSVI